MASHEYESVAADLKYLRQAWYGGAENNELRRGSAILRRLLVEDVLLAAWRDSGYIGQPCVNAPSLTALLGTDFREVDAALAGNARQKIGDEGHSLVLKKVDGSE